MRSFGETPGKREALLNKLVKISETPVKREETPEKGEEPRSYTIFFAYFPIWIKMWPEILCGESAEDLEKSRC